MVFNRTPATCVTICVVLFVGGICGMPTRVAAQQSEPTLQATRQAALSRAGLDTSIDKWRARARWSNLVPYLDAETSWLEQHDEEHRFHEDHEADDSGTMRPHDTRNRHVDDKRFRQAYGIQLEWDLSGLVFDRREIYILREQRQRQSARTELVLRVTDLFLVRERAIRMLEADLPADRRRTLAHEKRRATALLDGLTDGWFSKQLN